MFLFQVMDPASFQVWDYEKSINGFEDKEQPLHTPARPQNAELKKNLYGNCYVPSLKEWHHIYFVLSILSNLIINHVTCFFFAIISIFWDHVCVFVNVMIGMSHFSFRSFRVSFS